MGTKRIVDVNFWNDDKVVEQFSPEDKLFMLYLMTNPHTTQLGIYAINKKLMAFELGYSIETISVLLERFERKYNIIKYSEETKEIAIKNYLKYSIVKGGKPVEDLLNKEIKQVKDKSLLAFVFDNIKDSKLLNETITNIINKYNIYNNINNINENDVSYNDTYNDTYNESYNESYDVSYKATKKDNFEEEFEELWSIYPNKKGKKDALKHYIKVRKKGISFTNIKDGIIKYNDYVTNNEVPMQYIKYGSSWFNQECWNDDYSYDKKETEEEMIKRIEKEIEEDERKTS